MPVIYLELVTSILTKSVCVDVNKDINVTEEEWKELTEDQRLEKLKKFVKEKVDRPEWFIENI